MLWEIEIVPTGHDAERERVCRELALLTHGRLEQRVVVRTSRGYLVEGDIRKHDAERLLHDLLLDPLVETGRVAPTPNGSHSSGTMSTVLLKPGVMDPVAQSVVEAARDLGISVGTARTFRRYYFDRPLPAALREPLFRKVLANEAIEQVIEGSLSLDHLTVGAPYVFRLVTIPLRSLDHEGLLKLSREGQLALNLAELQAVQAHFRDLGRDPTDAELETLAQTWSEHCSHKTLKGRIEFTGPDGRTRRFENLLKETIFAATQQIRERLGRDDWCVSVFEDNAGVVRFDDRFNVCFKVETHNHPSAIEPYGGANTGVGGVIRDPLGTALGAKPICNTDVFCFAPPDTPPEQVPPGVLHPRKVMLGVVAGVRDYGNRMGIPTVNGAVCFDPRYLGNPLVYCGTVGLIPVDRCRKEARPGDLIVVVGGRTGRDGIHGATFSSIELTAQSEAVSGGAVQIGNAITEKKLLDVVLQARDRGLYHAITDCGAGGFSSAIGEMAANLGATVHLDRAPLKYEGLSYTEIWISEAQERMILAVPPEHWSDLQKLCASEDVEATALGAFENTGRLRLFYQENQVADLDMHFLHGGRPPVVRQASWQPPSLPRTTDHGPRTTDYRPLTTHHSPLTKPPLTQDLLNILSSYNVCSKEWIIRQYDHEVQGGTVIKPLVGAAMDGPGDAAVITPVLGSFAGLAIGCGINPRYGDLDPYAMAASAIDEAVRNVIAVGADPRRIALLDNFCWGNTDRPEMLGALVLAAEACREIALAYGMPFISGKDSLNNEFRDQAHHIVIPPTLLISAMGRVPDVRRCVTMDLKSAGNVLYLVGVTRNEMGGSHDHLIHGLEGGVVPRVDLALAPHIFARIHEAIQAGLVRSCHDLSEGGLAVALAEMAFAGGIGADIRTLPPLADVDPAVADDPRIILFAESNTRFIVEVHPNQAAAFDKRMADVPCFRLGSTIAEAELRISDARGEPLISAPLEELKGAWQRVMWPADASLAR